jgi:hypothetical protein
VSLFTKPILFTIDQRLSGVEVFLQEAVSQKVLGESTEVSFDFLPLTALNAGDSSEQV